MARIVLIHGYGVGLTPKKSALPLDLGFSGFFEGLVSKEVSLFSWYQEEKHSLSYYLNPVFHLRVYKKERHAGATDSVLSSLKDFLSKEQPEILVCHSLGAFVFLQYLKKYKAPQSLRRVVFVQADFTSQANLPKHTQFSYLNLYCPWDPALIISWMIHGQRPAGLIGWKQPQITNKLLPLSGSWNLHNSNIEKKQFARFISSL